jgi:hypothetical protein
MLNDLVLWSARTMPPGGGSTAIALAGAVLVACVVLGGWMHECTRLNWIASFRRRDDLDLPETDHAA